VDPNPTSQRVHSNTTQLSQHADSALERHATAPSGSDNTRPKRTTPSPVDNGQPPVGEV